MSLICRPDFHCMPERSGCRCYGEDVACNQVSLRYFPPDANWFFLHSSTPRHQQSENHRYLENPFSGRDFESPSLNLICTIRPDTISRCPLHLCLLHIRLPHLYVSLFLSEHSAVLPAHLSVCGNALGLFPVRTSLILESTGCLNISRGPGSRKLNAFSLW